MRNPLEQIRGCYDRTFDICSDNPEFAKSKPGRVYGADLEVLEIPDYIALQAFPKFQNYSQGKLTVQRLTAEAEILRRFVDLRFEAPLNPSEDSRYRRLYVIEEDTLYEFTDPSGVQYRPNVDTVAGINKAIDCKGEILGNFADSMQRLSQLCLQGSRDAPSSSSSLNH